MRQIKIEKITLNFGAGTDQSRLDKGMKLIKKITGRDPVKTFAKDRVPSWNLRKGLPIGCKLTLRGEEAEMLLVRLLKAKDNKLRPKVFDNQGNLSFGISEYIDLLDIKYDSDIGMLGFEVSVTLERPGFRVKRRKGSKKKVPLKQRIQKQEAMEFMNKKFNITIGED